MNNGSGVNSVGVAASAALALTTSTTSKLQRRPSLKFRMSFRTKKTRQAMVERTCNELALEGERLCKEGRWSEGVERLESAARAGTQDLKTLSALYSQLGNAYFYLENYSKSLEYHKQDLTLARTLSDKLGEAKACGNIGSALKALGQFDESVACCRMQLDIAREISDKVLESRALYNLGNVYHARGKSTSTVGLASNIEQQDAEESVKTSLIQAARHYEANLKIVKELGDYHAQGRTLGNLGNTYYLLGNYKKAIKFHEERLSVAELLGDKVACRRAYSNLGNAQMFLGKYTAAAQYYLHALEVAREVGDIAVEAQSCYSLGNTYTLIQNYHKAIEFHMRHLQFAVRLDDRIGEARAYWSLGNSYSALGDHRQARHFANKHLQLSIQLGDEEGIETAKRNLADLDSVLELSNKYECPSPSPRLSSISNGSFHLQNAPMGKKRFHVPLRKKLSSYSLKSESSTVSLKNRSPRDSRAGSSGTVSPTSSLASSHDDSPFIASSNTAATNTRRSREEHLPVDDGFLDMISKSQSRRLDDQRSTFPDSAANTPEEARHLTQGGRCEEEDLFDTLWRLQGSRIDDQRCDMPSPANGLSHHHGVDDQERWEEGEAECLSSDELFDMIFECQSSRINDQRSPDPRTLVSRKSTMPSEDFFNLIQHLQSTRIEDQRSPLPVLAN